MRTPRQCAPGPQPPGGPTLKALALPILGAVLGAAAAAVQLTTLRFGAIAPDQQVSFWGGFVLLGLFLGLALGVGLKALRRRTGRNLPGPVGALLLAAALAACVAGNARPLPHVFLFVVDTTRADHLSLYGYRRDTSPNLVALGRESVVFDRAYSQGSSTIVTMPSLLASVYPTDHGMVDYRQVLDDGLELMSEKLRDAGYTTFGVVTNPHLGPKKGFDRGFDVYERIGRGTEHAILADSVHTRALEVLDELPAKPIHGFVMYTDPHAPYEAPGEFQTMYDPDWTGEPITRWPAPGESIPEPRTLFQIKAQYDGTITYWDHEFGRFREELTARGLWQNSLVVVTADHGEEFLDHGHGTHGHSLYEELVRVPLLVSFPSPVRFPPLPRTSRRVDELVSSIDVLPTVLEYLRLPVPEHFRGRSVADLALGGPDPGAEEREVYLEQITAQYDARAVVTRTHKCIVTLQYRGRPVLGQSEVYDLTGDPTEQRNLVESEPELTAELQASLMEYVSEITTSAIARSQETIEPSEQDLEELRALGYVD